MSLSGDSFRSQREIVQNVLKERQSEKQSKVGLIMAHFSEIFNSLG